MKDRIESEERVVLKALKSLREPAAPSVSIGAAGQVNLAAQQVNARGEG